MNHNPLREAFAEGFLRHLRNRNEDSMNDQEQIDQAFEKLWPETIYGPLSKKHYAHGLFAAGWRAAVESVRNGGRQQEEPQRDGLGFTIDAPSPDQPQLDRWAQALVDAPRRTR